MKQPVYSITIEEVTQANRESVVRISIHMDDVKLQCTDLPGWVRLRVKQPFQMSYEVTTNKGPMVITTPPPDPEETARLMGLSKRRVRKILKLVDEVTKGRK